MDLKGTYSSSQFLNDNKRQKSDDKLLLFENFQNYESFYAEVYRQMFQILFSYGMQICGNRDLVKDSIQELFSELWKNERTLIKVRSIKPYLLKCFKRKIRRALGKGGILYVEGSDLNAINPNDIETIDVLKDAASTAIYGSRGASRFPLC